MARNAVPSGENQSVTGAIDILDLLASNAEPIGVREIARRLALAPSNVQRLIKTLTKAGFLEQTQETLRYRIGYRAFQVGSAFVGQNSLYSAVMPELYALASSADFAMVAEGTDFRYAGIEAGKAFFKITVHGAPQFYTPFVPDAEIDAAHPNAIVRAGILIPPLQEWAREYERRFVYHCKDGTIVPKAVIGAIRGGNPYHITRTSELFALYLDCRLTPDSDPLELRRELRELLSQLKLPGTVELFLYRRSYGSDENTILLDGLRAAHRRTLGGELELAEPVFSSMWRDVLAFNEMGIPAITYGPPRSFRKQAMSVDDLLRAAEIYAGVAIEVCNREKPKQKQ